MKSTSGDTPQVAKCTAFSISYVNRILHPSPTLLRARIFEVCLPALFLQVIVTAFHILYGCCSTLVQASPKSPSYQPCGGATPCGPASRAVPSHRWCCPTLQAPHPLQAPQPLQCCHPLQRPHIRRHRTLLRRPLYLLRVSLRVRLTSPKASSVSEA